MQVPINPLTGLPIPMQPNARVYRGGRSLLDNIYGQSSNPLIQANPPSRFRPTVQPRRRVFSSLDTSAFLDPNIHNPYLRNKIPAPIVSNQPNLEKSNTRKIGLLDADQPKTTMNGLLDKAVQFATSDFGKDFFMGMDTGYSKEPKTLMQTIQQGYNYAKQNELVREKNQLSREKFDFEKTQATIDNLLTQQGLDIELQKILKPKLSSFALELRDLGIPLDSPEAKRLFLQKLEGAKTEINLGEKTDALFKTKFYENTLLKNTNDLNEKTIDNEDMRKTYQQMSLLMKDGVSTGIIDSAFLNVKRLARDLGILTKEQAETISQQELFQKLSNFTVPRMRVAGSGATSNFEAELFKDATATLGDDESTNKIIIQSRLSALNLQREYADFYNQFMSTFDSESEQKDFTNKVIGDAFREYLNDNPSILSNLVGLEEDKIIASEENLSEKIKNGILKAGDMIFSNDAEDDSYNSFVILNDDIINQYLN